MASFVGFRVTPGVNDGSAADKAAPSALAIKIANPSATDGTYYINLPTVGVQQVYCIMNSNYNGGGWMLALKATNTSTAFTYTASHWTSNTTLNSSDLTRNALDAKFDCMNYYKAGDLMAIWPDITTGAGGSIPGNGVHTWLEPSFNSSRTTLIDFFQNGIKTPTTGWAGTGIWKGNAKQFSGWASGIFSSQVDIQFYGFNYVSEQSNSSYATQSNNVRWGFAWNENGEGTHFPSAAYNLYTGSNDVRSGIGLNQGWTAGDQIGCCNDTSGINRTARVEMYVR